MKLGPGLGEFWGKEEEGKEGDAYNVELAAPVLMLSELERPNMAVVGAKRPAPRNTGFAMTMVSFLLGVCDVVRSDFGRIEKGTYVFYDLVRYNGQDLLLSQNRQ